MTTSTLSWIKSSLDGDSGLDSKCSSNTYCYFRLASESSADTDNDTESIYSIQDKETDFVKDTSDTESNSAYEVEIEYDLASLSDSDRDGYFINSSSECESEDIMLAAAVVCDSSLDTFNTDAEDSDNSMQQDTSTSGMTDFWICIQCKSQNDNPQFRFCDKCFQDRKTFFPPRPRRHKKARRTPDRSDPVHLDQLQSCLSGLSQDSGIGSSQEFPSLCLDEIVVPKHLTTEEKPSTSVSPNRKRQISESSISDLEVVVSPRKQARLAARKESSAVISDESPKSRTESDGQGPLPECKEICIMCNINPKNSVFLHGRIAHMCCCYKCAMRTWKSLKRCPICKRKVSNVVRVFTT